MDRRQRKTRTAIFSAFQTLLERKPYSAMTVQDIIDEADIGRSTFYSHFETKDELLGAMCTDIFNHVFSDVKPYSNEWCLFVFGGGDGWNNVEGQNVDFKRREDNKAKFEKNDEAKSRYNYYAGLMSDESN